MRIGRKEEAGRKGMGGERRRGEGERYGGRNKKGEKDNRRDGGREKERRKSNNYLYSALMKNEMLLYNEV